MCKSIVFYVVKKVANSLIINILHYKIKKHETNKYISHNTWVERNGLY
jgi:hypothetical protein